MVPLTHGQIEGPLAFVHGGGLKIFGLTQYEFDTLILPSVYSDYECDCKSLNLTDLGWGKKLYNIIQCQWKFIQFQKNYWLKLMRTVSPAWHGQVHK